MSTKFLFIKSMDIFGKIPQYHIFLEAFVVLWISWFIVKRRYGNNNNNNRVRGAPNDDLVERKLAQFKPEELVDKIEKDPPFAVKPRKITSRVGKRVIVDGRDCLNVSTHNYLSLIENKEIEEKAVAAVNKYGVGSCGPRGFYGTVDIHLELEERLAQFMGSEEAVVYSYGFSTIASAIPAYCKRKDIVFVDEKVNFSIQKGLDASRSTVRYFKHNDPKDLENILISEEQLAKKHPKSQSKVRRFLIVEGIYMNTGKICPLPELIRLCQIYKLRVFIDESISFGTLGKQGKGVTEHFQVPIDQVDMIMGSLDWAVGSIGGFCVGSSFVIEHQRLSGLGYCFSASLPPLLTSAAITSLDVMSSNPELLQILKNNCLFMNRHLQNITEFEITSFAESPVKHLYLKEKRPLEEEEKLLKCISDKCFENNLALIMPAYLKTERETPRPSLRICVSVALDQSDIIFTIDTLKKCVNQVFSV